jgi:hypothetical protein
MALELGALRTALLEAGASPEKAEAAAQEGAQYETRLASIERRLTLLTWQVGVLAAAMIGVGFPAIWLLLRIAAKVGA